MIKDKTLQLPFKVDFYLILSLHPTFHKHCHEGIVSYVLSMIWHLHTISKQQRWVQLSIWPRSAGLLWSWWWDVERQKAIFFPWLQKAMVAFTSPRSPTAANPPSSSHICPPVSPLRGSELAPCKDARESLQLREISPGFPYTRMSETLWRGIRPWEGRDHWNAWAGLLPARKAALGCNVLGKRWDVSSPLVCRSGASWCVGCFWGVWICSVQYKGLCFGD